MGAPCGKWCVTKHYLNAVSSIYEDPSPGKWNTVEIFSTDATKEDTLPIPFRLYDDDGLIYFSGLMDDVRDERVFRPLDEFGRPGYGCTELQILEGGQWVSL